MPRMRRRAWPQLQLNWRSRNPTETASCVSWMRSARSSHARLKRRMLLVNLGLGSFDWLPLPQPFGKWRKSSWEAEMSQQESLSSQGDDQLSQAASGGGIYAESIAAT